MGLEMDKKLDTVSQQADQVRELIDGLRERVADGSLNTTSGLSFLEVKHHTMLSYLSNLSFLALLKLHGRKLQGHEIIKSLIEDRTVLEKMKPLEQRLKYQIDKLLQTAITSEATQEQLGTTDDPEKAPDALADPSAFKPNPSQLAKDIREEDQIAMESGVYRAPKQTPVHYEDNAVDQREREEQRLMERASRSRLVQDLMAEYDDRPEKSTASGNPSVGIHDSRMERLATERARYEEENFTRLAMNKKERKGL
ncbi:Sas10/Utp3/C1D family-domain-containing protein, partial [Coemansia mojavensis]